MPKQRTRKAVATAPRSKAAPAAIKPKRPRKRKDVDLAAEGVTVKRTKPQPDPRIIGLASAGNADARATVKRWGAPRRAKSCPPGLTGTARKVFVEQGITFGEQLEDARQARLSLELLAEPAAPARKRSRVRSSSTTKEATVPSKSNTRTSKSTKRNRKENTVSKPKSTAKKSAPAKQGIGVADLAKQLGADPKELRAFMRSELGLSAGRGQSYSWTSAKHPQAKRIVSAYRKANA